MSNYEKLKNDDLKKLLTERGLSTTGKKADFVARLVEHDNKSQGSVKAAAPVTQKDVKDIAPGAHTTGPAAAAAAASSSSSSGGQSASAQKSQPQKDNNTVFSAPAGSTTAATTGATPTAAQSKAHDDREAKLAARAARFGIPVDEEEQRKKARAARFGQSNDPAAGITVEDKALSQPQPKKTKGQTAAARDNKTPAASKPATTHNPVASSSSSSSEKRKVSVLDDPVEAEKARKRALKFGTASVSNAAIEDPTRPPKAEIATTS